MGELFVEEKSKLDYLFECEVFMDNYLLTDFKHGSEWNFSEYLTSFSNEKWTEVNCVSTGKQKSKLNKFFSIYLKYFIFPFKIFLKRKKTKNILAWQQFYGIVYAFYCRLFLKKKSPNIYIMTFIYTSKKGLLGYLYYRFVRFSIKYHNVKKIFVYTKFEVEKYSKIFKVEKEIFEFVHIGISSEIKEVNSKLSYDKFFLSAGRTNRDYDFLLKNWPLNCPKLIILSDTYKSSYKNSNVVVLDNIFGDDYLFLLKKAIGLILSLDDSNFVSSGQLFFLNCLKYEKAIIITKHDSMSDYAINNINCLLIDKKQQSLINAINFILDDQKRASLEKKSKEFFDSHYSLTEFAKSIIKYIS